MLKVSDINNWNRIDSSTPAKKAAGRFHEKAAEKAAAAYIIIRVGAH